MEYIKMKIENLSRTESKESKKKIKKELLYKSLMKSKILLLYLRPKKKNEKKRFHIWNIYGT
ncbi:hypothetical protein HQ29_01875 [Porphyromonas canoris]|uniref:Uncharacterized protein n=1 Tax=Porphyromonas canoris TaxID=36875 RepID=A0ABR4XLX6_9PORP|nr:hypothetical protein HQ29_01875 [Porphyromonas canoris]KGN92958.1 hypothetical protein HQ43_03555 [Porphyromonas canoris]